MFKSTKMRHRSDTMINYSMPTLTEKESCPQRKLRGTGSEREILRELLRRKREKEKKLI